MKKISKWITLGTSILLALGIYISIASAEDKLTGGEFVIKLVHSLGIDSELPNDAAINDYINILKEEQIIFPADFDPAKPITREQKADLLSQALYTEEVEKNKFQMRSEIYRDKAVIKKITGKVTVKRGGTDKWIPAELDMELTESDYIKTGPKATAFLRVGVAGRIEIRENSELLLKTLASEADTRSDSILIYLAMGEISVDVRHLTKNSTFETQTPSTVASVRGTIYIVRVSPVDGKTEIRDQILDN